jgi:hypothetical protein
MSAKKSEQDKVKVENIIKLAVELVLGVIAAVESTRNIDSALDELRNL